MLDPVLGSFLGHVLSVSTVVTGITELLKIMENSDLPVLKQLVNFVDKASVLQIRIFVAALCVVLNYVLEWYTSGIIPAFDVQMIVKNFSSFFMATAGFILLIKPFEKTQDTEQ